MSRKIVDAKGMLCPKPLILTKKALMELKIGGKMNVLIDNVTSVQNVERFLKDNGSDVSHTEKDGVYDLTVTKGEKKLASPDAQSYCSCEPGRPHVICIKNDKMGFGSDELGIILIKGFINTIKEASPLPEVIVFYNNGIKLTLENSPVLDSLKELETLGVKILVCGTCADYFKTKDLVKVGIVSNMYDIVEALTQAKHVVCP